MVNRQQRARIRSTTRTLWQRELRRARWRPLVVLLAIALATAALIALTLSWVDLGMGWIGLR